MVTMRPATHFIAIGTFPKALASSSSSGAVSPGFSNCWITAPASIAIISMYRQSTPMACTLLPIVTPRTVSVELNLPNFRMRKIRNSRRARRNVRFMPPSSLLPASSLITGSTNVGRIERRSMRFMGVKKNFARRLLDVMPAGSTCSVSFGSGTTVSRSQSSLKMPYLQNGATANLHTYSIVKIRAQTSPTHSATPPNIWMTFMMIAMKMTRPTDQLR
mmetsp:Transcript_69561/g.197286  ORF Transcript_69561/g.197286 Transcript_69561/m.197286 type:complete len:218 (+) Transcript_69561:1086-1739(+)